MEIKIYWTKAAREELNKIFVYYRSKVNRRLAVKITSKIVSDSNILKLFPEIGVVEKNLKSRPQKFRFILSSNYKIIYWVNRDENQVEIVDVFDMRLDPQKLQRNK